MKNKTKYSFYVSLISLPAIISTCSPCIAITERQCQQSKIGMFVMGVVISVLIFAVHKVYLRIRKKD